MPAEDEVADLLLEAQVSYLATSLVAGDDAVTADWVQGLLDAVEEVPLRDLVDQDEVAAVVRTLLERVPPSTAVSTLLVELAPVVHRGPDPPATPQDLMTRDQAAAVVQELRRAAPAVEAALHQIAESPMVGTVATGFLTRIVTDVVGANRAVAERIPGVGGLLSLGDKAASAVLSAAEAPMQLVGDTAGKGAALAVRRLATALAETLQDPALQQAAMEVWDDQADRTLDQRLAGEASVEVADIERLGGLAQDIMITASTSAAVQDMVNQSVGAFFTVYGAYPLTTLLEEMGVTSEDAHRAGQRLTRRLLLAAADSGVLRAVLRAHLEPFFRSPDTLEILRVR